MGIRDKLLVRSGVFANESKASYAISIFDTLKKSRVLLSGDGTYSIEDFPKYLTERCGVDPKYTEKAIELLKEENLGELARKVEIVKIRKKLSEFGTKSY